MVDDIVSSYGFLTLGTRFKRLGDRLQADTQRIIEEFGLPIQAGQYPFLAAIDAHGPLTVGDLATAVGVSQPGATRMVGLLARQGLVQVTNSSKDQRQRLITLTMQGRELVRFSRETLWPRIEAAVRDICEDLSGPLLDQLAAIERELASASLEARVKNSEIGAK